MSHGNDLDPSDHVGDPYSPVGAWLLARMAARGVSRQQLGLRSGLHPSSISRILAGKSGPKWSTVRALASALGDDPESLLPPSGSPVRYPTPMVTWRVEEALRADPLLEPSDITQLMRRYRDIRAARLRGARIEP